MVSWITQILARKKRLDTLENSVDLAWGHQDILEILTRIIRRRCKLLERSEKVQNINQILFSEKKTNNWQLVWQGREQQHNVNRSYTYAVFFVQKNKISQNWVGNYSVFSPIVSAIYENKELLSEVNIFLAVRDNRVKHFPIPYFISSSFIDSRFYIFSPSFCYTHTHTHIYRYISIYRLLSTTNRKYEISNQPTIYSPYFFIFLFSTPFFSLVMSGIKGR